MSQHLKHVIGTEYSTELHGPQRKKPNATDDFPFLIFVSEWTPGQIVTHVGVGAPLRETLVNIMAVFEKIKMLLF